MLWIFNKQTAKRPSGSVNLGRSDYIRGLIASVSDTLSEIFLIRIQNHLGISMSIVQRLKGMVVSIVLVSKELFYGKF